MATTEVIKDAKDAVAALTRKWSAEGRSKFTRAQLLAATRWLF